MIRRATPDSEAVASSEDEKPWPSATTFGSLPRKENGVPGLGGGIWATQSRGSFKLSDQARRIAAREARLGAPNPTHSTARSANTPSPAASSEGTNALPFAIPLQPTPKAGRSLSHSQGQREMPFSSAPSVQPLQAGRGMVPMGLLNEAEERDDDTESEDDYGSSSLTLGSSQPPLAALQRTVTMPSQYENYGYSNRADRRAETMDEAMFQQKLNRGFEAAFGGLTLDQPTRRPQWQSSLGWEELPNINESRRHSLADIPTRRGSLVGINHDSRIPSAYNDNINNLHPPMSSHSDLNSNNSRNIEQFTIPEGYRVPFVALEPHERANQNTMLPAMSNTQRPRKMLYVVSFKCSRVGVFYLLDNTGLVINEGDMVIVEADRGQDLGTVQHARVTAEEAKTLLAKYGEEQYKWLMMFSRNNQAGAVNPNATVYGDLNNTTTNNNNNNNGNVNNGASSTSLSTRPPRDQFQTLKPKAIKRMAAPHEINMLKEKEGNEAKAKRACQQKVYQHHLDMEILEAEFQWDWQKLIFYYYADHYVNFKDLVNDLYKCYKVRLWMSAVNPASFSQNAVGQPPTGIGPGAVGSPTGADVDQSYTMLYGTDPDPYGAVPTYRIPDVYNASMPGPAGVPNDFSQQQPQQPAANTFQQQHVAPGAAIESFAGVPFNASQMNDWARNQQIYGPIGSHPDPFRGGPYNNRPGEAYTVNEPALFQSSFQGPWRSMDDYRQTAARDAAQHAVRLADAVRAEAARPGGNPNNLIGVYTPPAHPNHAAQQHAYPNNINRMENTAHQQVVNGRVISKTNNGDKYDHTPGTLPDGTRHYGSAGGFAPRGTPDNRSDRYDQKKHQQ